MKHKLLLTLLCLSGGLAAGSNGFCASVRGSIRTADGALVGGVRILVVARNSTATDPSLRQVALASPAASGALEAVSTTTGDYSIDGLAADSQVFKLDPGVTGFKPGEVVAAVGKEGLRVDWVVSAKAPALAFASRGVTTTLAQVAGAGASTPSLIPGLSPVAGGLLIGGTVSAIVVGGTLGGIAAGGGFGSSGSPSQ